VKFLLVVYLFTKYRDIDIAIFFQISYRYRKIDIDPSLVTIRIVFVVISIIIIGSINIIIINCKT